VTAKRACQLVHSCFEGWHAVTDKEDQKDCMSLHIRKIVTSEPICEVMRKSKFLFYMHCPIGHGVLRMLRSIYKVCYVRSVTATTTIASYWTSSTEIVINPRDSDEEK
jgi:hypothetical protein